MTEDHHERPPQDAVLGHRNGHDVECMGRKIASLSDYYICVRCGAFRDDPNRFDELPCDEVGR